MSKFLRLYVPGLLLVGMIIACGSASEGFKEGYEQGKNGGTSTEKTEEEKFPNETTSQRNARQSAEDYLSVSAYSRTGLVKQLEYEDYSTEDATYAVDALDVDWKDQAAKSAKEYMDVSSYSRQGLKDQLKYEGFTEEEAEYGVAQVYDK
jgi:hypothetical protein